MPGDEAGVVYAVRLAGNVARTIAGECARMEALNGSALADRWREGMLDTVQKLATLPERCAVASEDPLYRRTGGLGGAVRQISFQQRRGGPAWRLLFTVHAADENHPPTVWVRHIRHGAQSPMQEWPTDSNEEP